MKMFPKPANRLSLGVGAALFAAGILPLVNPAFDPFGLPAGLICTWLGLCFLTGGITLTLDRVE